MTRVCVFKSKLTAFSGFECTGHSGYADEGADIICAAVSSATELVIGILEKFSVDFSLEIREDTAHMLCKIAQTSANAEKCDAIANVVGGYAEYLKEISGVYPKHLKCILTEK